MIILKNLLALFSSVEKRNFLLLCGLMVINAFVQVFGVASVAPLLAVIITPENFADSKYVLLLKNILPSETHEQFSIFLGLIILGIMLVGNLFILLMNYLSVRFANNRERSIARLLLQQYLAQDYLFFASRHSSSLIRNLYNEVAYIASNIISRLLSLISSSISVFGIIVFIFYINPLVTVILGSILSGAYALTYLLIKKPLYALGKQSVELTEEKLKTLTNIFRLMRDIKMQALEQRFTDHFNHLAEHYAAAKTQADIAGVAPRYLIEIFAVAALVFAIIFLMSTSSDTNILPTLGIYAFAGFRLMPALQQIFLALSRIQFSAHSLDLIANEVRLTSAHAYKNPQSQEKSPTFTQNLAFENVFFTYPAQDAPTLKALDFTITKKQKVAFVGRSGEGKSTLIDIISGLTTPTKGRFLVDGQTINQTNQNQWRQGIGYASQNVCLIDDTIDMNITLAKSPGAIDHKHLARVKEEALIDFEIDETTIGEDGKRLSGGQRQRLIIARALYQDKDILILDEATSAMDKKTEQTILQTLSNLDKTLIFISHNVGSLEFCDYFYLIQNGQIAEAGDYRTLKRSSSLFQELINAP